MWTASELIPFGFDDGIAGEVHVCHKANNNTNGTEDERDEVNPIGVEEGDDRHGDRRRWPGQSQKPLLTRAGTRPPGMDSTQGPRTVRFRS